MNPIRTIVLRIGVYMSLAALVASMAMILAVPASARVVTLTGEPATDTLAIVDVSTGSAHRLVLVRFTLEPGDSIRAHSHSGPAVVSVISGTLQAELIRGIATVNRDGVEELADIGESVLLLDGDSITYDSNAGAAIKNGGDEPLVLVASLLLKPYEPLFNFDYWPPTARPHLQ